MTMASIFLATTGRGLARAERNASDSWVVTFLLTEQDVRCLAHDPLQPEVVYAGTQGNGVLRSVDQGKTWQPSGLGGQIVKALATSRVSPSTVYAGTKPACLFVSQDGGENWRELASFRRIPGRHFWFSPAEKPFIAYVQSIALSPTDPGTILVGIEAGAVVKSLDGGRTWSGHRQGALRDCHSLTFHTTSGEWVYEGGGTGAGVSVSHDAGTTWTQPKQGLDRHYGWAVAADPAQADVWYASVAPGAMKAHSENQAQAAIVRSIGGAPWQRVTGGLPQPLNHMPYALLTDPTAPGHVYTGLSSGEVWHSTDHGDTWHQLPFRLGGIHRALLLLP
jgi:photosystem II stability/assembly factor-like uncharacterized protein